MTHVIIAVITALLITYAVLSQLDARIRKGEETLHTLTAVHNSNTKNIRSRIEAIESTQKLEQTRRSNADDQIEQILIQLSEISESIGKLDVQMDYQQNRMNVMYPWFENSEYNPKRTGGVPWASEITVGEDNE